MKEKVLGEIGRVELRGEKRAIRKEERREEERGGDK